jgi:hypothetical protein
MDEFRTRGFIPWSKKVKAELERVDLLYRAKYVDPGSGAKATIFEPDVDLYRVTVKHVMVWEYGTVANRTDWTVD